MGSAVCLLGEAEQKAMRSLHLVLLLLRLEEMQAALVQLVAA